MNIEQEKDREKGKVGGRPAKLNEGKNKGDIFFVGRTTWKLCGSGDEMRNASGHQCKVKMSGSEKKKGTIARTIFPQKERGTKKFLMIYEINHI